MEINIPMKTCYLLFSIGIISILDYSLTTATAESYQVEIVAENLEVIIKAQLDIKNATNLPTEYQKF